MATSNFFNKDATADLDATIDQLVEGDTPAPASPQMGQSLIYVGMFVFIGLVLYFLQPKIVQRNDRGKMTLCNKRLVLWTVILGLVASGGYYYAQKAGYKVPGV